MKKVKRIFLIILDSLGIGAAPDAHLYGDENSNTLKRISYSDKFDIKVLRSLGLGNIDGVDCIEKSDTPLASYARLEEISRGKDTTTGHWEIAGIVSKKPMPTYPDGFPEEIINAFTEATGRGVLCNAPYSGTDVIRDFGREHMETGKLIVYTSADSVFQIAAHEEVVPPSELYTYCRAAREILTGDHGVGRVIARPFITENGEFKRTANRRDFSLKPPKATLLDEIRAAGLDVISVGKIYDIFAGEGITEYRLTHSNSEGMQVCAEMAKRDFRGLCMVNLVEFDSHYGHRQDVDGYAAALSEFDLWLGEFLPLIEKNDLLIISADHGCDPGDDSTDHTREYVPYLAYSPSLPSENLGTVKGFGFISERIKELLGIAEK